ncbi:MAG: thiamine-phosphate synthase family protein [Candidatus Caldarchaeum sp.]|nr:thiamine-phosphate synthase family protein [Candidatus Caldarchaeum sp.]
MMTKVFLPAVRGLVVHRLKKHGKGQTSIARYLGITQSAVSQILAVDEKRFYRRLEELGVEQRETTLLVDTICDEIISNPVRATQIIQAFWLELLSKGRFCDFHRRMYPQLINCDICIGRIFTAEFDDEKTKILKELEKYVKKLESSRWFAKLIPQVGTNLVYSVENPKSVDDVAGVVGRIVAVDDEVRSVGKPAFGGSHHLALVLLTARKFDRKIRAAVNLNYSENMKRALDKAGLAYAIVAPHTTTITDETVLLDLESVSRSFEKFPEAIVHGGGVGYEPITYLFAEDLEKLFEKVLKLSNRFLSS